MKYTKICSLFLVLAMVGMACKTEIVERIDEFNLEQGGYMRIVTPFPVTSATFKVSKKNVAGSKAEMQNEAVTIQSGALFSSYDLEIRYVGATTTAYKAFRSIPASAYAKDATTGYPRHTLTITGTEAMTAMALDTSKMVAGNKFEIKATMKLSNGKSFNADNTGVNITGGAFYSSPFLYTLNVTD